MITIVAVDEEMLERAARLLGVREKAAAVRKSLETLIAGESARRLAALGGSEKQLQGVPRSRIASSEIAEEGDAASVAHECAAVAGSAPLAPVAPVAGGGGGGNGR